MEKLEALGAIAIIGGRIRKQRSGGQETYTEFPDRFLKFPEHLTWEIFDPIVPAPDYDSGTQHLLQKIQRGDWLFGSQGMFSAVQEMNSKSRKIPRLVPRPSEFCLWNRKGKSVKLSIVAEPFGAT